MPEYLRLSELITNRVPDGICVCYLDFTSRFQEFDNTEENNVQSY